MQQPPPPPYQWLVVISSFYRHALVFFISVWTFFVSLFPDCVFFNLLDCILLFILGCFFGHFFVHFCLSWIKKGSSIFGILGYGTWNINNDWIMLINLFSIWIMLINLLSISYLWKSELLDYVYCLLFLCVHCFIISVGGSPRTVFRVVRSLCLVHVFVRNDC